MTKTEQSLLKVGVVSRAHGLRGEIFIRPLGGNPDWPSLLGKIFIGSRSFAVEGFRPHKGGFIFQLKGVGDRNQGEALAGLECFLPKSLFQSASGERIYLSELLGFAVEAADQGSLGLVESFCSSKHQDFLAVRRKPEAEPLLIPFVLEYIEGIDFSRRRLKLKLPSGFPGLGND